MSSGEWWLLGVSVTVSLALLEAAGVRLRSTEVWAELDDLARRTRMPGVPDDVERRAGLRLAAARRHSLNSAQARQIPRG